jgi:TPR repeat protein
MTSVTRAWHAARDTFLGLNYRCQDVREGLRLARACQHEDAVWLCSLFDREEPRDADAAKAAFVAQGDDRRALCFLGLLEERGTRGLVRRAAEGGYALAQALVAGGDDRGEAAAWAQRAASQREPLGVLKLAQCCWQGSAACPRDQDKARALFREAAELGAVSGMYNHAKRGLNEADPERYVWLGRAAALGHHAAAMEVTLAAEKQLGVFRALRSGRTVLAIGEALRERVDTGAKTVFELACDEQSLECAEKVLHLSSSWRRLAEEAIRCWLLIGRRQRGTNRDVRMLIAKLLWRDRGAWSERGGKMSGKSKPAKRRR